MTKKPLNKEIPIPYTYAYARLREKIPLNENISPTTILFILRHILRLPKVLHYPILKQMEECELIKRINHQHYHLLKSDCIKEIKHLGYDNFWR